MRNGSKSALLGTLLVSVMIGANVTAQTVSPPPTSAASQKTQVSKGTIQQTQSSKGGLNYAAVKKTPACQHIVTECKNLGFIVGEWKTDNGVWKDCFDPIVKGSGGATRDGKPISVPASSSDVQACRASALRKTQ